MNMNEYEYNEYSSDAIELIEELNPTFSLEHSLNTIEQRIAIFKKYDENVREERIRFIRALENRTALCLSDYERLKECMSK